MENHLPAARPRLLDLFCCAGGATKGYQRAGFEVFGIDRDPQPEYCGEHFSQEDALDVLRRLAGMARAGWHVVDAIHASPPCQATCTLTLGTHGGNNGRHPDLYPEVRELLEVIGLPYVIENPSARPDVVLCGEMFGLGVLRHRKFELGGWGMPQPAHLPHRGRVRGWRHGQFYEGPYIAAYGKGGGKGEVPEIQRAMGMPWVSTRHGLIEAIPPAYTEHIGWWLREHLTTQETKCSSV
jgi:hypothetical protein